MAETLTAILFRLTKLRKGIAAADHAIRIFDADKPVALARIEIGLHLVRCEGQVRETEEELADAVKALVVKMLPDLIADAKDALVERERATSRDLIVAAAGEARI